MARQGDLFGPTTPLPLGGGASAVPELPLARHQLEPWQQRLAAFQRPLFEAEGEGRPPQPAQADLFAEAGAGEGEPAPSTDTTTRDPSARAAAFTPLTLTPQHLQFWRWPSPPQRGAALYVVIDQPPHLASPLLLYVGETGRADQRWKGDHDCKDYLAAYGEAACSAGLGSRLSIRFWFDVPSAVRPRRELEQALIRRWQPPFNKETRQRWATPFQAEQA
ncbi:GIY-YIG nuclease family protein [Cyanobium sp. Morenito 9A2]|uniref:GIY-YIG nuclease family protein n=1 Tax=Cyanobium sp. Morenito 9A2 TaxID=2823718 RepID=UPI0020CC78D1|nr:GIY-YIG nuclease family protein [Cyanobium sp. Morenito 9A2]MCP9849075.1 GIY-YIG nuclease family protein [Cyanobium sp. Morenito 9A2]